MGEKTRQAMKTNPMIAIGAPLLMALAAPVAPLAGPCRLLIEPVRLAPADKPRWYATLDRDPGPGFVAAKEAVAFLRVDGLMPDGTKLKDKVVEYVVAVEGPFFIEQVAGLRLITKLSVDRCETLRR